jgi:hypothetical protein
MSPIAALTSILADPRGMLRENPNWQFRSGAAQPWVIVIGFQSPRNLEVRGFVTLNYDKAAGLTASHVFKEQLR